MWKKLCIYIVFVVFHFFLRLLSLPYSRYFCIFSVLQCFCSSWNVAWIEVYVKNMKMLCFFSVFLFILVCLMFMGNDRMCSVQLYVINIEEVFCVLFKLCFFV